MHGCLPTLQTPGQLYRFYGDRPGQPIVSPAFVANTSPASCALPVAGINREEETLPMADGGTS
jgi:hypothetical protein